MIIWKSFSVEEMWNSKIDLHYVFKTHLYIITSINIIENSYRSRALSLKTKNAYEMMI